MSNQAYASTRAKARRAKLLPEEAYGQLMNMELAEIARYIQDLEYRKDIDRHGSTLRGADLIETALMENLSMSWGDLIGFCNGELKKNVEAYADKFRIENLKTLLRGIYQGMTADEISKIVSPLTEKDKEQYARVAEGKNLQEAIEQLEGDPYQGVLREALEKRKTDSMQPLEDALDVAYYDGLMKRIKTSNAADDAYKKFVKIEIDIANIKTAMRLRHRGVEGHPELFIDGGDIDVDALVAAQNVFEIMNGIEGTPYHEYLENGLGNIEEPNLNGAVSALEEYIAKESKRFSYLYPVSILPILDYLLRKQREVKNLRAIVRGKDLGLTKEIIEKLVVT
tara:strand:+ start:241 stop:1257 length:1017 start_codon:yes stop_codon:yes gene_type:complete